jgi:hypothetical protein
MMRELANQPTSAICSIALPYRWCPALPFPTVSSVVDHAISYTVNQVILRVFIVKTVLDKEHTATAI